MSWNRLANKQVAAVAAALLARQEDPPESFSPPLTLARDALERQQHGVSARAGGELLGAVPVLGDVDAELEGFALDGVEREERPAFIRTQVHGLRVALPAEADAAAPLNKAQKTIPLPTVLVFRERELKR